MHVNMIPTTSTYICRNRYSARYGLNNIILFHYKPHLYQLIRWSYSRVKCVTSIRKTVVFVSSCLHRCSKEYVGCHWPLCTYNTYMKINVNPFQRLILGTTKAFVLEDKAYWRIRQVVVIDKAYVDHLEMHQPYSAMIDIECTHTL